MAFKDLFTNFDQKTLVTIGLILIIILGLLSYNLYFHSNYDNEGSKLGCLDTIRNIFGMHDIYNILTDTNDLSHIESEELEKHTKSYHKSEPTIIPEETVVPVVDSIEDTTREVFNIDNSDLTYDDAKLICKVYDSELASYQQLVKAHKKGANWCNYGWSKGQMALFPLQQHHYDELQENNDPNVKTSCGKVGINGGKFANKNIKFGANCYGIKPRADPSKITYISNESIAKTNNIKKAAQIDKLKKQVDEGTIEIRPFNNNQWSKYSTKKSTYMLTPKETLDLVISEEQDDLELDPRAIIAEEEELDIVDSNVNASTSDVL